MARGRKTGGRVKGTPNKLTKEIRIVLKNLVFSELESFDFLIKNMEPRERLEILIKILPFVVPKVHSVYQDRDEAIDLNSFYD